MASLRAIRERTIREFTDGSSVTTDYLMDLVDEVLAYADEHVGDPGWDFIQVLEPKLMVQELRKGGCTNRREAIAHFQAKVDAWASEEQRRQDASGSRSGAQNQVTSDYINPDAFFNKPGAVTFIFTTDGEMYYGWDHKTQHYKLIGAEPDLSDRYEDGEPRFAAVEHGDLVGRVGRKKDIVSFWNTDPQQYETLLQPCLNRLMEDGLLLKTANVSTPIHGTIAITDLAGAQTHAPDMQKMELYKQLHLMRGAEKQAAMKELGVGGGGKPHPMQYAMDKAGLRVPGQRWWAPHSESFSRQLDRILENSARVVYHGTVEGALGSIYRTGIGPGRREGADAAALKQGRGNYRTTFKDDGRDHSVFVSTSPEQASVYAARVAKHYGDTPVVVKIELPPEVQLIRDEAGGSDKSFRVIGNIPASCVVGVLDLDYDADALVPRRAKIH